MKFKMVAFGLSGVLVNFNGAENAWDFVRKAYQIPNLWKDYTEGKVSRRAAKVEEFKEWRQKGIKLDKLMIDFRKNMKFVEGVKAVFSDLRAKRVATAILSDSPHIVVEDVANQLGVKYFSSNKVLFDKAGFAYETIPSHPSGDDRVSKMLALKDFVNRENIRMSEVAVVGNGREDIDLFRFAGRGISFNAKDYEVRKASQVIINSKTLEDVLEYLK